MSQYKINTKCVQGGYTPGNGEPRQIPIVQSTTFKYATSEDMGKLFDLEADGYFYSRLQNPTCDLVAKKICEPYDVDPRRTASILDIFATAQNGFVFWAGLTVDCASLVDGVAPMDLVFFAIYPACIIIMALLSIRFDLFSGKGKKAKAHAAQ